MKKKDVLIPAFQVILNIILINSMTFLALLGIHEISHLVIGMRTGCEYGKAVLLDTTREGPYSELSCPNITSVGSGLMQISGLLGNVLFGLLFFLLKDSENRNLSFIILGFSILFAGLDIVAITNLEILFYFSFILGLLIVVFGEYSLTSEYIERKGIFV